MSGLTADAIRIAKACTGRQKAMVRYRSTTARRTRQST